MLHPMYTLASAVPETRKRLQNVKYRGIWGGWGHSRSSAIAPFDRAHMTPTHFSKKLYVYLTVFVAIKDICRKLRVSPTRAFFAPRLREILLELHQHPWQQKTGILHPSMMILICLAVLMEFRIDSSSCFGCYLRGHLHTSLLASNIGAILVQCRTQYWHNIVSDIRTISRRVTLWLYCTNVGINVG